jgi:hypothetical protein
MDNLLSYIDFFTPSNCHCTDKEYSCYKKNDFIKCKYKDILIKKCPYINILLDNSSKYDLIEKPIDISSCDDVEEYKIILQFLIKLIAKQDEYIELSKIVGFMCIFYIRLTNIKYNIIPKSILYEKLDLIIQLQKEHINNKSCNTYNMTQHFNKYSISEFINIITKWKEYI